MEARSLKFIADACGGILAGGSPDTMVNSVCSDSRKVQRGDVFLALPGETFDGHDFIATVVNQNVAAVIVEAGKVPTPPPGCAVIVVDSTRLALGRLGSRYREDFNLPVIAVGGSNGKTSTKELLATVLGRKLKTLASEASFNNDIGVPVTLLRLEPGHQAAVLEVGTNHPGELGPLLKMIRPKFGVITSIGREHLEYFGDMEGVLAEEGTLAEVLPSDGRLIVNGDGEWAGKLAARTEAAVMKAGLNSGNDWRAKDLRCDAAGTSFTVEAPCPEFSAHYRINLLGKHQVVNALHAVALGAELGLSAEEVREGLSEAKPAKMRLQTWDWNGVCVIDDAYNANADSMVAALETLRDLPCAGRRVAVLGDMAELGRHSDSAHAEVGRKVAESGVKQLFAIGKMAHLMARAAHDGGLKDIKEFEDAPAAVEAVKNYLKSGDVVLLKASRSARMERLSGELRQKSESGKT